MRYFFLLVLILFSCAANKENPNPDPKFSINDSTKSIISEIDTIKILDTIVNDRIEIRENEMMIIGDDELRRATIKQQKQLIHKHQQQSKLKIIDKSSDIDTTRGWIAYSVPEQMQVAKNYSVKVRISKRTNKQNKAILILGDEDAINNSEYNSVATIEDIKVFGEMTADLRGDSESFKIVCLSTSSQNIDEVDYTEWEWVVVPKKSGSNPLKLVIKVKDVNKDIVVFNKNILIKKNVSVAVEGFFDKYWQWFMTTIIIPIFIYFWNRKKKTKKS